MPGVNGPVPETPGVPCYCSSSWWNCMDRMVSDHQYNSKVALAQSHLLLHTAAVSAALCSGGNTD